MKQFLKLAAPYIAVMIGWSVCRDAWLTILLYHLQILLWSRGNLRKLFRGWSWRSFLLLGLPCALAGPLVYFLMPHITSMPLSDWLAAYGLTSTPLLLMVPYFGILHPLLEQAHWGPIREGCPCAHAYFTGYHALVLYHLLSPLWLGLCLAILASASVLWAYQAKKNGGAAVPVAGHVLADLGIVIAAWIIVS